MATTTISAIREKQQDLLRALTPGSLSRVKFRAYRDADPFEDWAEQYPEACMRRYVIRDTFDHTPPEVSDGESEELETVLEMVIAYPVSWVYDSTTSDDANVIGEEAMEDVVSSDLHQIRETIGLEGYGDNVAGHIATWTEEFSVEKQGKTMLVNMSMRVRYRRAIA